MSPLADCLVTTFAKNKINTFVNFVNTHAQGNVKRRLYTASYGPGLGEQHNEIRSIAQAPALHYAGPVYWANVATVAVGSAYVNYLGINHDSCAITARTWTDAYDNDFRLRALAAVNVTAISHIASGAKLLPHVLELTENEVGFVPVKDIDETVRAAPPLFVTTNPWSELVVP